MHAWCAFNSRWVVLTAHWVGKMLWIWAPGKFMVRSQAQFECLTCFSCNFYAFRDVKRSYSQAMTGTNKLLLAAVKFQVADASCRQPIQPRSDGLTNNDKHICQVKMHPPGSVKLYQLYLHQYDHLSSQPEWASNLCNSAISYQSFKPTPASAKTMPRVMCLGLVVANPTLSLK